MDKLTDAQIELLKGVRAALRDIVAELDRMFGKNDLEIGTPWLMRAYWRIDRRLAEAAKEAKS